MPATPCIVFSAFRSAEDPRLRGWATYRDHVQSGVGSPAVAEARDRPRRRTGAPVFTTHESGIWRLLASNSRELGRSAAVYASFAEARAHVLELKGLVDDMAATTVAGPAARAHGWVVTVGGAVVMTSGRWYGAASLSRAASAGTIRAFREALVTTDARHSTMPGRRARRVPADEDRARSW